MENKEIIVRETVLALLEDICGDDAVRADGDINLLEEDLMDSLDYTELLVGIEEALSRCLQRRKP